VRHAELTMTAERAASSAPASAFVSPAKTLRTAERIHWSHALIVMSRSKRDDEREFRGRLATREKWEKRTRTASQHGSLSSGSASSTT
jgi:hypothetical protein